MPVPMIRYWRKKNYSDDNSPVLCYLKQEPGSAQTYDIESVANEIEVTGALSAEDVVHTMKAFVRQLRKKLIEGNKVKVDGLGIFYITASCLGAATEKECTVRNIKRVNTRFLVDGSLRLVNNATATTRNAPNNVSFAIKGETVAAEEPDNTNPTDPGNGNDPGNGGDDGGFVDPAA